MFSTFRCKVALTLAVLTALPAVAEQVIRKFSPH